MKKLLAALSFLFLVSCGGGGGTSGGSNNPGSRISVAISPTSASADVGSTVEFTATVSGTTNTAVTWQVNGAAGGSSTVGTISSTGSYVAPAMVPNPANVTVTAVSNADTNRTASASVTIHPRISISPASATVAAGATWQFSATVTGTTNTGVNWQVNGVAGGNATVGTISASGLYTAPASPPATGKVTVTAVASADTSKKSSATVTDVFSRATLNGSYSFRVEGDDTNGPFFAVGSFQADGNGNITKGLEDLNYGNGWNPSLAFTGSYAVNADGRGTMTFTSASIPSTLLNMRLVVISNSRARFIQFDAHANGEGLVLKRDSSAFSATAIGGNFSFGSDGLGSSGNTAVIAGRFTLDGAVRITAGHQDENEAGSVKSDVTFTGIYTVDTANGRGTATLNTAGATTNFVFHIVSADTLFMVESDYPFPAAIVTARRQQATSFSNASLNGDYAFMIQGIDSMASIATAGRFTSNGLGALSSGVLDMNDAGSVTEDASFTGTAFIALNGRGTVTFATSAVGTLHLTLYMVSSDEGFFVQTDSLGAAGGILLAQHDVPFSTTSATGSYGFLIFTINSDTDTAGQASLDGGGALAGTEDQNDFGTLTKDDPINGTVSISSEGRGVASVTTSAGTTELRFYVTSDSRLLVIQADASAVGFGNIEKQY